MKKFTVDFENVTNYYEFYEALIKSLEFPEWCGKNPDAIWDLLTSGFESPVLVEIKNSNKIQGLLKQELDIILEVFNETREWYKNGKFNFVVSD